MSAANLLLSILSIELIYNEKNGQQKMITTKEREDKEKEEELLKAFVWLLFFNQFEGYQQLQPCLAILYDHVV